MEMDVCLLGDGIGKLKGFKRGVVGNFITKKEEVHQLGIRVRGRGRLRKVCQFVFYTGSEEESQCAEGYEKVCFFHGYVFCQNVEKSKSRKVAGIISVNKFLEGDLKACAQPSGSSRRFAFGGYYPEGIGGQVAIHILTYIPSAALVGIAVEIEVSIVELKLDVAARIVVECDRKAFTSAPGDLWSVLFMLA